MSQTPQESLFRDTVLPTIASEKLGRDVLSVGAYVTAHAGIGSKYLRDLSWGVDPMVAASAYQDDMFFLRVDNPAAAVAMAATVEPTAVELVDSAPEEIFPSLG